jgi:serine/threonine protein phosphatase PrpC
MRSGLLRGREHTKLGVVATLAEGPCAIALSRGGHKKTYRYRDANEDAAGFALGPEGTLLAVADGHGGHEAAELAVAKLFELFAAPWTGAGPLAPSWVERACEAIGRVHAELIGIGATGGNPDARTTLAFALVRPAEDLLGFASVGDSHVFVADVEGALDLAQDAPDPPAYLGTPSLASDELGSRLLIGAAALAGARAIALATDGLSEYGIGVPIPEVAVADALAGAERVHPGLRALEAARALVDCALDAHRRQRSGDNVATAILILEEG